MERGWGAQGVSGRALGRRAQEHLAPAPGALHGAQLQMGAAGAGQVRSCWIVSEYFIVTLIASSRQQQLFEAAWWCLHFTE